MILEALLSSAHLWLVYIFILLLWISCRSTITSHTTPSRPTAVPTLLLLCVTAAASFPIGNLGHNAMQRLSSDARNKTEPHQFSEASRLRVDTFSRLVYCLMPQPPHKAEHFSFGCGVSSPFPLVTCMLCVVSFSWDVIVIHPRRLLNLELVSVVAAFLSLLSIPSLLPKPSLTL